MPDLSPVSQRDQSPPALQRVVLGVEYDGSPYFGWQVQAHSERTVQAQLQQALASVANHSVKTFCAGRTDTGVHATGQVVHFDTRAERDIKAWVRGANSMLDPQIRVRWAQPVAHDFHARFSATARRYVYVIDNRPVRSALYARQLSWEYRPLDLASMVQAAQALIGEHDFTSYRALHCQAHSPVRRIEHLRLWRQGNLVFMDIKANGFLHHMVRNIAGVLIAIGCGKAGTDWAAELLQVRDRCLGGVTASPQGLYLVEVDYPGRFELPQQTLLPLFFSPDSGA